MKIDKSLKEVWEWKDLVFEETKDLSMDEKIKKIKKDAERILKESKLDLVILKKGKVRAA